MKHIAVVPAQLEQTMTSREIAELVESRHDSVKRTIDRLVDNCVIAVPPMVEYIDSLGRPASEYKIGKRDSYVIVAQLSPAFTAKLVDRWQELENGAAPSFAIPQSFADALRLAADQQETIQRQIEQLALAAPKVDFVDRYVQSSTGSRRFREVAKLLAVKETEFREFLFAEKIMYRLHGKLAAYAPHMDAGRFEMVAGAAPKSGHSYVESMFTAKGVEWVAGEWAKFKVRAAV